MPVIVILMESSFEKKGEPICLTGPPDEDYFLAVMFIDAFGNWEQIVYHFRCMLPQLRDACKEPSKTLKFQAFTHGTKSHKVSPGTPKNMNIISLIL